MSPQLHFGADDSSRPDRKKPPAPGPRYAKSIATPGPLVSPASRSSSAGGCWLVLLVLVPLALLLLARWRVRMLLVLLVLVALRGHCSGDTLLSGHDRQRHRHRLSVEPGACIGCPGRGARAEQALRGTSVRDVARRAHAAERRCRERDRHVVREP